MSDTNSNLVVPRFRVHTELNAAKSKAAGRPIYDDMEVCEIRLAANPQTVGVFPAHEVWKIVDSEDGGREPQTYAMRFRDQYAKFKDGAAQAMSGTPIEELPFLTAAKRMELKALNIYTAETLAALDGAALKRLGVGGREHKVKAQAYLDNATGSADVTRLAEENESLKEQMTLLRQQVEGLVRTGAREAAPAAAPAPADDTASEFEAWSDADLKEWIKAETGNAPRGNPSHETLVRMADEVNSGKAEEAA